MDTFEFTSESVVEIKANSSLHPIEGQTNRVTGSVSAEITDGEILLEPAPSGHVEMPVDALESGHKLQDKEMRRRVEAKQYPVIRYELDQARGGPERFTLLGTLTFHGVSQQFEEEATVRLAGDVIHVEGEHTFDIRDFGVKPPKILTLQVYPEVRVVARLVAKRV